MRTGAGPTNIDATMRALDELVQKFTAAVQQMTQGLQNVGNGGAGAGSGVPGGADLGSALGTAQSIRTQIQTSVAMNSAGVGPAVTSVPGGPAIAAQGGGSVVANAAMSMQMQMSLPGQAKAMLPTGGGGMPSFGMMGSAGALGGLMAGVGIARMVAAGVMDYGATQLNMQSQRMLTGGADIMGQTGALFRAGGAMIGLGGPAEAFGRWIAAPAQGAANAAMSMIPFAGAFAGAQGPALVDSITGRTMGAPSQLQQLTDAINSGRGGKMLGFQTNPMFAGMDQVGRAGASIMGGLFAGGIDPFSGGGVTPATDPFGGSRSGFQGTFNRGNLLDRLIGMAGTTAVNMNRTPGGESEALWRTLTRRTGRLVGNRVDEVMEKVVSPIYGSLPETGGNVADIMSRFGPEGTLTYLRTQNDALTSSVDPMTLSSASAGMRSGNRAATLGALQVRGSGAAAEQGYRSAMSALAGLPGGKDSLAYAQERQGALSAQQQRFSQTDAVNFGIPSTMLQGAMQRASVLPYNPSNLFAMAGTAIAVNDRQIGVLQDRMKGLRDRGELSEDAQLQMVGQIEALRTQNAYSRSMLTEGRENLIPGLVAGRRRSIGAFTSDQATAMAFGQAGIPIFGSGAMNGAQKQAQNDYATSFGNDIAPTSRSGRINNLQGSGSMVADGQVVNLLQAILASLQGGSAQGRRSDTGQGYSDWSRKDVGRGNVTIQNGAN